MDIYTIAKIDNRIVWAEFGHVFLKKMVLDNVKQDLLFFNGIVPNNFSPDNSIDFLYNGTHIEHCPVVENDKNKKIILLHHKYKVFKYLNLRVDTVRDKWNKCNFMQDYVYKVKYDEAVDYLKNTDKDEKIVHDDYPFVFDYAEIYNIPVEDAAEKIIVMHKKVNLILARSEKVRMVFYRKIKNADSLEELNIVLEKIKGLDKFFTNFQFTDDYIIK
jgi:hypothetical protein